MHLRTFALLATLLGSTFTGATAQQHDSSARTHDNAPRTHDNSPRPTGQSAHR